MWKKPWIIREKTPGFDYNSITSGTEVTKHLDNPGDDLIVLNPDDIEIAQEISSTVKKLDLKYLHERVLPRSLFGLESDVVEKNPGKFIFYENIKERLENNSL